MNTKPDWMEEAAIDIASMAEDIIKKHAPVLGHKAHGQAANWGDWKDHIEFEDGSLEAVFNKLLVPISLSGRNLLFLRNSNVTK
jgi:hypothetical protein